MSKINIKYWADKSVDYAIGFFAGGGWLISVVVAMLVWHWSTIIRKTKSREPKKLKEIKNQNFKNCSEVIDGKFYINCSFESCTLEYFGGECRIKEGSYKDVYIKCRTPETANLIRLLHGFGYLNPKINPIDEHGIKL